jgi:hypothetical protein
MRGMKEEKHGRKIRKEERGTRNGRKKGKTYATGLQ